MSAQPIQVEQVYDAPVQKIWEALTNKEQMRKWYFDMPDFRLEEGAAFSFKGIDHDGKEWIHLATIQEIIPLQKLVHTWKYENQPGESVVSWELFEEGNMTRARLIHSGVENFPPLKSFARQNFEEGWNAILGQSLKDFVEQKS